LENEKGLLPLHPASPPGYEEQRKKVAGLGTKPDLLGVVSQAAERGDW
jgi:hypothetical protein